MNNFLMKPKIDFAFKEIMNDEKARTGFLAAVLHLDPADIKSTRILNPYLRQAHADDKLGILDVRILMNDDTEIDTEIQLSELKVWSDRSLFYAAKMYTDQIKPGQKYNVFKKCVSISILDFILFEGKNEFYSCFHILEDTRHFKYTDKMEFHVIELPKLAPALKENSSRLIKRQNRRKRWHYRNQCPAQPGEGEPTGYGEEAWTACGVNLSRGSPCGGSS